MNLGMIFDMDGVLIDSENFYFDRRMQFFKEKTSYRVRRISWISLD